jgi:hypothetical protein
MGPGNPSLFKEILAMDARVKPAHDKLITN